MPENDFLIQTPQEDIDEFEPVRNWQPDVDEFEPVQQAFERPPPVTLPTDDEVRNIYDMAPIMTEKEREDAKWKLEAYYRERENNEAKERRKVRQQNFLNDDKKKEFYKTPEVIDAANANGSPNDMYARWAVTDVLENDMLKRKLLPGEYEPARNKLIGLNLAGQPEIGDQEAFGVLKNREENAKVADLVQKDIHAQLLLAHAEDLLSPEGKPVNAGEVFEKIRGKHGDFVKGRESVVYSAIEEKEREAFEIFERNKPVIRYTLEYLRKANAGAEDTEDAKQIAIDAMLDIPEADLKKAVSYAVDAAEAMGIDSPNALEGLITTVLSKQPGNQLLMGKYNEIDEKKAALANGMARIAPDGSIFYDPSLKVAGSRKLTADEHAEALHQLGREEKMTNASRVLREGYRRTFEADPVFANETWGGVPAYLERGTVGAIENLPVMVASSFGWIGKVIYTSTVGSDYTLQMLNDNPGMDRDVAKWAGYSSAASESFLEAIKFDFLKTAWTKGLWKSLRDGGPAAFFKTLVGFNISEAGVEGIQDYTSAAIQKLIQGVAHDIDPSMNVGKIDTWRELSQKWIDSRIEVQGQILVMGLVASGVGTYKHLKDPERELYNHEKLKGYGLTDKEIKAVLGETDKVERDKLFGEIMVNMPPEQIAEAQLYQQQKVLEGNDSNTSTEEVPKATLESTNLADGSKVWHVLDEKGKRILENVPADVALRRQAEYQQQLDREQILKRAQEGVAEQNVAADMEAEARWEQLKPEDKTTAANILTFQHVEQPRTAEEVNNLQLLNKAVASHNKQMGTTGTPQADEAGLVEVDVATTRAGLGATNFIRWYESTFGKRVQFVASKSGQPLSFSGLTDPSDPNVIFLDAAGNRNVLSLLGHEWSHTLEHSNPKLWADIVRQMKPLVVDWAKQTGKAPPGYKEGQATPEFVANVIGDAFGDPEFWATVRDRHSGLFERMLQAIMDWFDVITDRVSEYGTDAPDIIRDLKGMRNIIARAMEQAQEGPEIVMPGPTEVPTVISSEMNEELRARGYTPEMIAGMTPGQAHHYMQTPEVTLTPEAQASLRAFQGSGVKGITRWLDEKIGTGEGHLLAGWGHYVAEDVGTARYYYKHKRNVDYALEVDGQPFDKGNISHIAAALVEYYGSLHEAAIALKSDLAVRTWEKEYGVLKPKAAAAMIREADAAYGSGAVVPTFPEIKAKKIPKGQLYAVDVDVEWGELLDLDRRMDDQPPLVLDRLAQGSHLSPVPLVEDPSETGWEMQMRLWYAITKARQIDLQKDPEQKIAKELFSKMLGELGIPGNTFADNNGRQAWRVALADYYEKMENLRASTADYSKYSPEVAQEYIKQDEVEMERAWRELLAVKAERKIKNNFVIWKPEAIEVAEPGAQPSQASLRKFEGRGERETDNQGGYVKPEEEIKVATAINNFLDAEGITGEARQRRFEEAKEKIHSDIMSTRARNPDKPTDTVKSPWSPLDVSGAEIEFKDAKEGEDPVLKAVGAWVKQSYRFDEIPEGSTREEWAGELSRRVVAQFIERLQLGLREGATDKQRQGARLIIQELEWYREFTGKLRAEFGGAADFMADLLGAFSPRQNVQMNWRNAVDFIWGVSSGKYDQLFSELDAYLKEDPAHTFKTWREKGGGILRARSGALFGTNTELGHMAALGMWREIQKWDAPKAKNFTRNIIGLSIKATIDVWAARLLDRVAGKPRIPVDGEQAVSGRHVSPWIQDKQSKKRGDVPVWVDIAKLDALWSKDPEFRVGPGGEGGIGTRYQNFGEWMKQGLPVEMSQVSLYKGVPTFIDGRHRFAWHRDQGHKAVQMSVPADQVEEIVRQVGAAPSDISNEFLVEGQFAFGQLVFEHVATAMRDPATWAGSGLPQEVIDAFKHVTAADVQATNWFVEKEIWTDNNWTNEEGSGGSFMHEIEQMVGTRFQVGLSQQVTGREDREDFRPQDPDQKAFSDAVHADLAAAMPDAVSLRAKDTLGMYKKFKERALDIEVTHGPGLEPNDLMRVALKHAMMKDQEAVHVSRVMEPDEDNPNARPGLEIYLKVGSSLDVLKPVLAMLARRGINGFTMVVDPRAKVGAEEFIGVRFQYIPEYSGDGNEWAKKATLVKATLERAYAQILEIEGVADVQQANYDTVVFKKGIDYDTETVNSGAIGKGEAVAWRRSYFDAVAAKAARRYARDPFESKPDILNRERIVPEGPAKPAVTPEPVTITAFDPALMAFSEREVTPTPELARMLHQEAGVYEKLIKCLS